MKYCILTLLLGLLIIPVTANIPEGSCDGYTNVTEPWRNKAFTSTGFPGFPKGDNLLGDKWRRFIGIGGDRVFSDCHDNCTEDSCGPLAKCDIQGGCICISGYEIPREHLPTPESYGCTGLQDVLDGITPKEVRTRQEKRRRKERAFLDYVDDDLKNNEGTVLPEVTVENCFASSMEVSGVGPHARSIKVSSEGDGDTGSAILGISDRLVSAMVEPGQNHRTKNLKSSTVDLSLETFGPGGKAKSSSLTANGNTMEINMGTLAENNNGSAAAAFLTLHGMESLLSHQYFKTENRTEMYSDVITAVLPSVNNTNLTEPVNFTVQHKKVSMNQTKLPGDGMVTCVYWEGKPEEAQGGKKTGGKTSTMRWSVDGCWVAYTTDNYTVCSCSHLSTFALIMQIGEPPPEDDFLEWLNRMCVIVGFFFFALAILTFLLCSWNPKINNTARLHLCLSLSLSHLLLLWNEKYAERELACTVMAGILHFLVVASFVWMQLEAVQLYLLVRRLTKVQVIQRDGLPRPLLYVIGYGVPFVIVGVSALVYSDGYGATEAGACWLSQKRNFNWALTGPVITILALNCMVFCATLWSLRTTLANMKSGVSQSTDTRLIVFKIVAQFFILGCTWILGLYQTNVFFRVLFIILNSQQGTFLFIVHCLLNKEVREEYMKWLTCCSKKSEQRSVKDVASVSEDLDKTEEQTHGGKNKDC
ncbi:adhesion G protein-coupled receptor E3-like [Sphaeramia orbicularis]|uniref:adhesion G protein-coupled receptor E3-like n=1 Tax=Sphaeramia orbicularis TaxID=375764 RepID=UPI00117D33EA|nr:adhesion G protein-coupled receptor E3-like [Sphaeramia orbicularis]